MNTRKYSNLQERRIAKKLQGKKQLNSGATMFAKGDVITDNFLVECKTKIKDSKSISIQKEWIEKLKKSVLRCENLIGLYLLVLGIMKIISLSTKNYLNN